MTSTKDDSSYNGNEQNVSASDQFILLEFDDQVNSKYQLPNKLLPVRISVLENSSLKDNIQFSVLADECIAYCRKYPEKILDFKNLLVRLCYLAGLDAGKRGNQAEALKYFSEAYANNPYDLDVAANCALALRKNNKTRESLKIYETILSSFLKSGRQGFSSQIWINVIELNCIENNFDRALELLDESMNIAPPDFVEEARRLAKKIRER